MFGRTVTIDGTEIFVSCCPDTPLSEVLKRAAIKMERDEQDQARLKQNKEIAQMLGRASYDDMRGKP